MKKKIIVTTALASCFALSATLTGCSVVSTNNKADMAQVIATVDITGADAFAESGLAGYKDAISNETFIYKRDLVSYFLTVGYSLVQSGRTYEETFNMLMDALVENAVLVQYSTMALLKNMANENTGALEEYKNLKSQADKYEYLLGGKTSDDVLLAKYKLYSSVNSAIDNLEKPIIEEEKEYAGTDTRTTPVNLETEQDDYYPKNADGTLNYGIYTGFAGEGYSNLIGDSGAYEDDKLDGSTIETRKEAYNKYLKNLKGNDLITVKDEESLKNVISLSYLDDEYVNQLESRIINKYLDVYEEEQGERLLANGYDYIQNRYDEFLAKQSKDYKTASAFETAMGTMSDSSFLLYSPATCEDNEFEDYDATKYGTEYGRFGFVYNILLPFSAKQSAELTGLKSILSADEDDNYYYNERNKLLKKIETEDQRSAWFNGTKDYSFKASENSAYDAKDSYYGKEDGREYLFFEGNLTDNVRYKELKAYDGRYSYNGTVKENEDGSYTLIANKLGIDVMLNEFKAYIDYVLGGDKVTVNVNENYYGKGEEEFNLDFYKDKDKKEIDYSKFLYATGNVELNGFKNSDLFNENAVDQYKAMSAVNELQFAYTTDTSVLSQYAGYSVSAYDTSYIKEFEYAAKLAISNGAGAFTVCAGDYGWHLIYVTSVFDNGPTYGERPQWERIKEEGNEGTFEYMFFEWLKSNDTSDFTSTHRSKIIKDYSKENKSVVKYQSRYQDLLDLESNN